jgi:uncharacterized protein (DUF2126 family)/transglutaminase-like putative cysteine protease
MGLHVALHHRTRYRYDRAIGLSPQIVRLRPAPHARTPVLSYSLNVQPEEHFLNWQQDPLGNYLARLVFPKPVTEFAVAVDLVANLVTINPFDFFLEASAEKHPFAYAPEVAADLAPYQQVSEAGPRLRKLVQEVKQGGVRTVDYLVGINRRVQEEVRYLIRLEPGIQVCEVTLEKRSGSCRDSAWLLCQLLRHLGLAARFVSGYLIQLKPDVKPLEGPAGAAEDFTDLHAWTEVYLPGAGWVGLDPTSGLLAGEGHIPLACSPSPSSAAPISGEHEECEVAFDFKMSVTRVFEDPRYTKPYTEDQWGAIELLGHRVDDDLTAGDVRLSMGGEPTFVSVDDMEGEEWNTAALGPRKRELGDELTKRLHAKFAPGGLLHYGQGKWYPGESLPRWAFACYWRKDGQAVWRDPKWFADEARDYGYGPAEALAFTRFLTRLLDITADHVQPGYEDAWYYLWRERRLPANVDPLDAKLKEPEERARLAKVFEQGLDTVIGYALPLQRVRQGNGTRWATGPWFFRPERMYLLPGDSPMGLRLPVESLPWVTAADYPWHFERDPLAPRPALPAAAALRHQSPLNAAPLAPQQRAAQLAALKKSAGQKGVSAAWVIRTALCVEPRGGRLYVFMPPITELEDYLALVAAVEDTAEALQLPVVVEGYSPPDDERLNKFKVTPDPGVIEVNIHPAHTWDELVKTTTVLYDEAHQTRLGTEKFMLDGRHTGTGGGNHIVLGGARPSDSPLLRRPDLLRSLLTYWHNHPSLTYLFSSLFVGPTSQAPRVDEARQDAVYELEIALDHLPHGREVPPWLVDRALRHLLVDVTGNTHRAEFCMDKLYAPETAAGRLGLLELRGFEMPPHARMSLTQQLLVRAMVAAFWKQPYEQRLVRWGTALHDRLLLPHFLWQDFQGVLHDLGVAGYAFAPEWFLPHYEFRLPKLGEITHAGMHLELRQAIEPWLVLGEEPGAGGTVRYVDSSVERVQVYARGFTTDRYTVSCNQHVLPLHPSGRAGEYVAGVRYRAWQPPSCLHPDIGVHTPLVFDVHDTWNGRAVAGCTYHVAHPGGRNYTTFPVNGLEAESRRIARFFPFGHTPGPSRLHPERRTPEFPMTLDLRRADW